MAYRPLSLIPGITGVTDGLFSDRFDRIDNLFSRLTGEKPLGNAPAYNLRQTGDNLYELTVSVPGWHENELDIAVQNGQLTISGKHDEKQHDDAGKGTWLHRELLHDAFSLSFTLHNRVKVQGAALDKGLLTLKLEYEIPEEEKPQRISITGSGSGEQSRVIEHKAD